jgi:hypothetical protein
VSKVLQSLDEKGGKHVLVTGASGWNIEQPKEHKIRKIANFWW